MAASSRILAIVALVSTSAPALPEPTSPTTKPDPNEVVCEKMAVSGSRVVTRRVCGTRAQWAELRRRESEMAKQEQHNANGKCQTVAMYPMSPGC